jgi:glycosyltransferase involved in cell wall biosynthesis
LSITKGAVVTVGITAFNEGHLLTTCWESVTQQTSGAWRAILILDGNADTATESVFEDIRDPRLKKIKRSSNHGPYPNRALAIQSTDTPWYFHLDADDTFPPNAIQVITDTIKKHPEAEFIYGDTRHFSSSEEIIIQSREFSPKTFHKGANITGQSPIRVSLYDKVGGFDKALYRGGADWDFWLGVAELKAVGVCCREVIYNRRRRRQNNVGSSWRFRRDEVARRIFEKHREFISAISNEEKYMGYAYEMIARDYRAIFNFQKAGEYAKKALSVGSTSPLMGTILKEAAQPFWRRWIRIAVRIFLNKLR